MKRIQNQKKESNYQMNHCPSINDDISKHNRVKSFNNNSPVAIDKCNNITTSSNVPESNIDSPSYKSGNTINHIDSLQIQKKSFPVF